ncbi:MAG: Glu/Leu/Phe/Val dehydrogenase family protein [bacterium]
MKSALKWQTGGESFEKRTVAVQGVGHVGYHLVRHLKQAGATVLIADIDTDNLARVTSEFSGVEVVDPKTIHAQGCDIFAPCALGAVISDRTLPELRCGIVAGCASNVLAEDRHGEALADQGILYAPDYVVNAGGLINVANELEGYNTDRATQSVKAIYDITTRIFQIARDEGVTTAKAADTLAERRIKAAEGQGPLHRAPSEAPAAPSLPALLCLPSPPAPSAASPLRAGAPLRRRCSVAALPAPFSLLRPVRLSPDACVALGARLRPLRGLRG